MSSRNAIGLIGIVKFSCVVDLITYVMINIEISSYKINEIFSTKPELTKTNNKTRFIITELKF